MKIYLKEEEKQIKNRHNSQHNKNMVGNNNLINASKKTSNHQTAPNNGATQNSKDYKAEASSSKSFEDGWNQVERRKNNSGGNNKGIKIGETKLPNNTINSNHSNRFNQLQVNEESEDMEIAQGNKATWSPKIHEGQSKVFVRLSRWERAQVERKTRKHNHQQGKLNVRSLRHLPESKSKNVEAQIQSEIENMVKSTKKRFYPSPRVRGNLETKLLHLPVLN